MLYKKLVTVLENHYHGCNTYILGDVISNGCTDFHINDIDEICKERSISDCMKQEVIKLHASLYKPSEVEYREMYVSAESDRLDFEYHDVELVCIKNGYCYDLGAKSDREFIRISMIELGLTQFFDKFVNDSSVDVRIKLAEVCDEKYLDILISDDHQLVRRAVAERGYRLDELVNDKAYSVKCAVVRHGNKEQLDILINDEDARLRALVAIYGDIDHANILINDDNDNVRNIALSKPEHWSYDYI